MNAGSSGERVLVASGPEAVASIAADLVVGWLAIALAQRAAAHVALTGGSSARGMYAELRDPGRIAGVDWPRMHLWVGDERIVPLDHQDSNGGLALRELLSGAGPTIPVANLHPVQTDLPDGAAVYASELESVVERRAGRLPILDVMLLGMGPDGHVLSVFPGSPALAEDAPLAMTIAAPTHVEPHLRRVTLSPALLGVADHVLVMVTGAAKAGTVAAVFGAERDASRWPAQLALSANATWLLDQPAAADLTA